MIVRLAGRLARGFDDQRHVRGSVFAGLDPRRQTKVSAANIDVADIVGTVLVLPAIVLEQNASARI